MTENSSRNWYDDDELKSNLVTEVVFFVGFELNLTRI